MGSAVIGAVGGGILTLTGFGIEGDAEWRFGFVTVSKVVGGATGALAKGDAAKMGDPLLGWRPEEFGDEFAVIAVLFFLEIEGSFELVFFTGLTNLKGA